MILSICPCPFALATNFIINCDKYSTERDNGQVRFSLNSITMYNVRPSRDEDIPVITEIYNYYVLHTTYTLEVIPLTIDEMRNRRANILAKNMPYLVAEEKDQVIGYAYCDWFKSRAGYRFSAEESIYLDKDFCSKGLGRQLLKALIHEAELVGIRKMIAVIGDMTNDRSIRLHRSTGFSHVGTFKSGGWKLNQWLDVTFMERSIGEGDTTSPE